MPLCISVVRATLEEAFPGADIQLIDLAGDNDHYELIISAPQFEGLSRVAQHQLVYSAFKGKIGTELHALALKTSVKKG